MTLLLDDRAGSRDLLPYLTRLLPPGTVEPCRLSSSDISCVGNGPSGPATVAIEVKSIHDLISSADSGRLQDTQIRRMVAEGFSAAYLLYYGVHRAGDSGLLESPCGTGLREWWDLKLGTRTIPYSYLSLLCTMSVGVQRKFPLGFHILYAHAHKAPESHAPGRRPPLRPPSRSSSRPPRRKKPRWVYDLSTVAATIAYVYHWWQKPWHKHHGFHTMDMSRPIGNEDGSEGQGESAVLMPGMSEGVRRRVGVAMALRCGIGFERALAAARHFPSVRAMVLATDREWAEVPGIGKVVARSAVQAVNS